MPDAAAANRSLNTIRTELEYLRDSGIVNGPQFQSITAQLPQSGGIPSPYIDPRFAAGNNYVDPAAIAQASQDPAHPAHPQHPKHAEWAKKLGAKFGNAAVFGAGATVGSDLIHAIF